MKKKLGIILVVLLVAALLFAAYNTFLAPSGSEGDKVVKVEVVIENDSLSKRESFSYDTSSEFLLDLMEEEKEELGVVFEETEVGKMVVGMLDYKADPGQEEFFHISVNGEDAKVGVGEIPLEDGDQYKFELKHY